MPEGQSPEIGPFDRSGEASQKRFNARQKYKESTDAQVLNAVKKAEMMNKKDLKFLDENPKPDVVEEHVTRGFFRKKVTEVRKFFGDKTKRKPIKVDSFIVKP